MAAAPSATRVLWRFEAIGTQWEIETDAELGPAARTAVEHAIAAFDRDWSRFRPDSLVSSLARGAGVVPAPPDAADMFALFAEAAEATDGAVNPLVGDSLAHLGYDADYSFRSMGPMPAPRDWRERLAWTSERMALTEPAMIDVGALGKGRLVDIVLDIVAQWTEGDVVVDASGDIAMRGAPVRIALEHPFDPHRAIGVVEVADAALCASAVGRRAWGDGLHTSSTRAADCRFARSPRRGRSRTPRCARMRPPRRCSSTAVRSSPLAGGPSGSACRPTAESSGPLR